MAISKIHPIRYSVLDAVSYIINPDKTQEELLVSSYACGVHTADLEFAETASHGTKRGDVKAQHLIQAFAPGEVDARTAHEIGNKLAMELTNGEHEYVIATHVDKDHVHNHILFNQVSFVDFKKFRQNIDTFNKMQKINDTLCASYGLSVVVKEGKGKPYYEYKDLRTNNSHRQVLKNSIDSCIPLVSSFDELLTMLNKLGYEVKVTSSNYSLRKDGDTRFIRLKNLGDKYTYDAIITRIKYKQTNASPYFAPPKVTVGLLPDLSDKLEQLRNPAYANRVALSEVKRVAATYAFLNEHGISSVSEIEAKQNEWSLSIKEKRSQIKELENKIDKLSKIAEELEKKEFYNDVYADYLRSGKSKAFRDEHEASIILFESACKFLASENISPKTTFSDFNASLDELISEKNSLLDSYHTDVSNLKQLNIAAKNVNLILSKREVDAKKVKGKNKDKNI